LPQTIRTDNGTSILLVLLKKKEKKVQLINPTGWELPTACHPCGCTLVKIRSPPPRVNWPATRSWTGPSNHGSGRARGAS
jgi:hypothetical protein